MKENIQHSSQFQQNGGPAHYGVQVKQHLDPVTQYMKKFKWNMFKL